MNRAAPEPKDNMGQPEPRIEARLKVTGEARYASDFPVSNPAFAFLVTSSIAKGSIQSIDLREAKAVPGVLEIFTHENTGELKRSSSAAAAAVPARRSRTSGRKSSMTARSSRWWSPTPSRRRARRPTRSTIDYQAEKPSATFKSPGVTEEDASKVVETAKDLPQAGDAEAAFDAAEVKFEAEYGTPAEHHNPIELFTTTASGAMAN